MAARQLPMPGEIVKKSNALCRASWSADAVWEARLIAIVASKVNQDDKEFYEYEIPIYEIFREHKGGTTYKLLDKTTDRAVTRLIKIRDEYGSISKYTVFAKCRISDKRSTIFVSFHPDLKQHFLQLKDRFTEINLWEFLSLPSVYSQRIFEILKSWSNMNEVIISLQDLFDMLEVPESMKRYPDFRRFVLEKAHKDINKTTFKYEWEPVNQGRTVVSIRFIFIRKLIKNTDFQIKQKDVSKRNQQFKLALECSLAKNAAGGCNLEDNQLEVCSLCRRMQMADS